MLGASKLLHLQRLMVLLPQAHLSGAAQQASPAAALLLLLAGPGLCRRPAGLVPPAVMAQASLLLPHYAAVLTACPCCHSTAAALPAGSGWGPDAPSCSNERALAGRLNGT